MKTNVGRLVKRTEYLPISAPTNQNWYVKNWKNLMSQTCALKTFKRTIGVNDVGTVWPTIISFPAHRKEAWSEIPVSSYIRSKNLK